MRKYFEPFHEINKRELIALLVTQLIITGVFLEFNHSDVIPSPLNVLSKFIELISSGEFYDNLFKSFSLVIFGMGLSILIALGLSYISVLGFFKNLVNLICSFRYLTLTGLTFIFTILSKDTDSLRTNLLLFAIIPFFVTGMMDVINRVNDQDIELGYTLKKNRWWIMKEVVMIGTLDQVFVVMGMNFAICWLMITQVESLALNLGGIGTMLIKANKYVIMDEVIALLLLVLLIGVSIDFALNLTRKKLFKYSK